MTFLLRRPILWSVLGILATLFAFIPGLWGEFYLDDHTYITQNELLKSIPLSQWWQFFQERTNPFEFLPIRDLSYRLDWSLFAMNPIGYHIHNLILYLANIVACWWMAIYLCQFLVGEAKESRLIKEAAAIVALLFAVHPAHVESVAWIAGRKELLSGLFALLSLGFAARSLVVQPSSYRDQIYSLLCFVLALGSKAAVLPLALPLAMLHWHHPQPRQRWHIIWPMLVAIVFSWLHVKVGSDSMIRLHPSFAPAEIFSHYIERALQIIGSLTRIALWPYPLRLTWDIAYPPERAIFYLTMGGGVALLSLWAFWRLLWQKSLFWFALLFFTVMTVTYQQWIPFSTWSLASERFLYLSIWGLVLPLAWYLARWQGKHIIIFTALFILLFTGTASRAWEWADTQNLAASNYQADPQNSTAASIYLGAKVLREGKFAEGRTIIASLPPGMVTDLLTLHWQMKQTLSQITPGENIMVAAQATEQLQRLNSSKAPPELAKEIPFFWLRHQLFEELEAAWWSIVQQAPTQPFYRYNFALVLMKVHKYSLAETEIEEALKLSLPQEIRASAWNNLALTQKRQNRMEEAIVSLQKAMAADKQEWRAPFNLAQILHRLGREKEMANIIHEGEQRGYAAGLTEEYVLELKKGVTE